MGKNISLEEGLERLGLERSPQKIEKLEAFIKEIEIWNPYYKLVSSKDNLMVRHILDSLAAVSTIQAFAPKKIADIGSGAGFPGIPLSLWLDESEISLIERSGRRASFLRHITISLGLKNVRVYEDSMERATKYGSFDLITFRALSPISTALLNILEPILAPEGRILAYKGCLERARAELQVLVNKFYIEIRKVEVPGLKEERCLGIIYKDS